MANLVKWIEKSLSSGEIIEGFVIGKMGWGDYNSENVPQYEQQPRNILLINWQQDKHWIDYEFDSSYGAPGCNAICVWTNNRVLFVVQYDGSTSLSSVPRNPCDHKPDMPGG